jgi:hypothetical protein
MITSPAHIDPQALPQSWRDVVSPPEAISGKVKRHLKAFGSHKHPASTLDEHALAELVARVAADSSIWEPLIVVDAARRRYRLAFENELLDLWVLSWMDGQATGFHDHGTSAVALTAVRGSVSERHPSIGRTTTRQRVLSPGAVYTGGAGYIHAVGHSSGVPAVTIHAYSPPLVEVGQYRAAEEGRLWREPTHGRQELLDNTIAKLLP